MAGYEYSYGGVKLKVWGSDGNGYAYVGNLVYRVTGSSFVFESGLFGEGVVSGSSICYHLKDHLGSIRAIVDGSGRLLEENDYYAFGQRHPRSEHAQSSANRFKYNGKELQTVGGLGYLDYGARMYDQSLGRWFTTDPLSEKYYGLSPYVYCGNNPLNMIDLDGRVWRLTFDEDHEGNRKYNGYEWISEETTTFDAMTNSSDPDVFATVPEGLYQAKVGIHNGSKSSYTALKMRDVNATSQTIELGTTNPAYSDGRTYATGIDIHKAGKNNYTGTFNNGTNGVSQGCLLIDVDNWSSFIGNFNNNSQRSNTASVTVSCSLATPVNVNHLPAFNFFMNGTRRSFFKTFK